MKAVKTYFKIGICFPVYFVRMGFTARCPSRLRAVSCGGAVLQQVRLQTRGEAGWTQGVSRCHLGTCRGDQTPWGCHAQKTEVQSVTCTVHQLHFGSSASALGPGSGAGRLLRHLVLSKSEQCGEGKSPPFALWFGSTPGCRLSVLPLQALLSPGVRA